MSQQKQPMLEGLITRMIDRIGRKAAAKDPKIGRLKKKLADIQKDIDDIVDQDFGGKEPDWAAAFRKLG